MATNLDLDDKMIKEAVKIGKFRSKKDAVNAAVRDFVRRNKQASILDLAGKVEYYPDYDYKKNRMKKNS